MRKTARAVLATLVVAASLGACGGGGGGAPGGAGSSLQPYPLRASVAALVRAGSQYQLTAVGTAATAALDGDCSGTLDQTYGAANQPSIFNGNSTALKSDVTATLTFTNCTFAGGATALTLTEADYYSADLAPLGVELGGAAVASGNYGLFDSTPAFPETVSVGDSGDLGTLSNYADSAHTPPRLSYSKLRYRIEADTSTTAIANLISEGYNTSDTLVSRSQVRYRIDAQGRLTIVSHELEQLNTTPSKRYVFRCQQASCLVLDR